MHVGALGIDIALEHRLLLVIEDFHLVGFDIHFLGHGVLLAGLCRLFGLGGRRLLGRRFGRAGRCQQAQGENGAQRRDRRSNWSWLAVSFAGLAYELGPDPILKQYVLAVIGYFKAVGVDRARRRKPP